MDLIKFFKNIEKASDEKHKFFELRELKETIRKTQNECGSCQLWMTQQCIRETNSHKVSCGELKCKKFTINKWTEDFIKEKQLKVKELSKPCV